MILVVGPNPAIDRTAVVARLVLDSVLRPGEVVVLPGGKALNVARAARALGSLVVTTGIVGGHAGRWVTEAAAVEGLNPRFVETATETRTTYVVLDERGRSILVYEPSAPMPETAFEELLAMVERELLPLATRVVLAGSLPAGIATDGYARLVATCRRMGRPVLLDTSGPALAAALPDGPDIVKVGLPEAIDGGVVPARATALAAARALVDLGAGTAIVTDGSRGAAAWDGSVAWRVGVGRVQAVDPIGSGDAFTAGLLVALDAGHPFDEALAWGAAAGAANATTVGAGRLDPAVHAAAIADIRVERA